MWTDWAPMVPAAGDPPPGVLTPPLAVSLPGASAVAIGIICYLSALILGTVGILKTLFTDRGVTTPAWVVHGLAVVGAVALGVGGWAEVGIVTGVVIGLGGTGVWLVLTGWGWVLVRLWTG